MKLALLVAGLLGCGFLALDGPREWPCGTGMCGHVSLVEVICAKLLGGS